MAKKRLFGGISAAICMAFLLPQGAIEAADDTGSRARDVFMSADDLHDMSLILIPGPDGRFAPYVEPVEWFGIDPAGSAVLEPGSGGFSAIRLPDGVAIPFYGQTYDSFGVSGNGCVVLGIHDTESGEFSEILANSPRISAFSSDLADASQRTVAWRLVSDRLVITYASTAGSEGGHVQIELFLDGTVRLTYLELAASPGMVSLSGGAASEDSLVVQELDTYPVGVPDEDGDGLPTFWEQLHGLDPARGYGSDGASGDPDRDGMPNATEYRNGTNPNAFEPGPNAATATVLDTLNTALSGLEDASDASHDTGASPEASTAGNVADAKSVVGAEGASGGVTGGGQSKSGTVWYVDASASGAGTGMNWTDAFTSIQDGIGAASSGEEVWVAGGAYLEAVTMKTGVAVYGGFTGTETALAQRDWNANQTTIDASTAGPPAGNWDFPVSTYYHDRRTQTIYLSSELGAARQLTSLSLNVTEVPGQTLNNWTIRMKHTPLDEYTSPAWEGSGWTTVYQSNETISAAGWVTFTFSTPFSYNGSDNLLVDFSFNNSSFSDNGTCAYFEAGADRSIYFRTDSAYGDPLTWSGTTPTPNANDHVLDIKLNGTPVILEPADHAVTMNVVTNSRLDGFIVTGGNADGAYPHNCGAGIYCNGADATNLIANCTVTRNNAAYGGGVVGFSSGAAMTNCSVSGNSAIYGGGFYYTSSSPALTNCIVAGNFAGYGSAVLATTSSAPALVNCTVSDNTASLDGGLYAGASSSLALTNCILSGNTNHAAYESASGSDISATSCLFYGNPDGDWYDEASTSLTGAAAINALAEATGCVDGDPAFQMASAYAIAGTWTAAPSYDSVANRTTLTDSAATLVPGALVGRLLNCDTAQRRQTIVTANTATTVEIIGDVTSYTANGDAYALADYHLMAGSGARDLGTSTGAPSSDFDGDARPFDLLYDIGADEFFDTDGDTLADWFEMGYDGDPMTYDPYDPVTNPAGTDLDYNTSDTDGDGASDAFEISSGTDPLDSSDTPSLTEMWVDFAYTGVELGTVSQPFDTLAEAVSAVETGGTVKIKGDTSDSGSDETPRITKALRLEAIGGTVTIGAP